MILYLVYDKKSNSCSAPVIADSYEDALSALHTLNPDNISDLIIHPLTNLHSFLDLFLLDINLSKHLPDFLSSRSDDSSESSTLQPTGASLIPPEGYELSN